MGFASLAWAGAIVWMVAVLASSAGGAKLPGLSQGDRHAIIQLLEERAATPRNLDVAAAVASSLAVLGRLATGVSILFGFPFAMARQLITNR